MNEFKNFLPVQIYSLRVRSFSVSRGFQLMNYLAGSANSICKQISTRGSNNLRNRKHVFMVFQSTPSNDYSFFAYFYFLFFFFFSKHHTLNCILILKEVWGFSVSINTINVMVFVKIELMDPKKALFNCLHIFYFSCFSLKALYIIPSFKFEYLINYHY